MASALFRQSALHARKSITFESLNLTALLHIRDRCSSIWDDAEFRLTFALLFYRATLFHSRPAHVRIMNVMLRGMARALQIDISTLPLTPLIARSDNVQPDFCVSTASSSTTFMPLLLDSIKSLSPDHVQSSSQEMPLDFKLELVHPMPIAFQLSALERHTLGRFVPFGGHGFTTLRSRRLMSVHVQ